MGWVCYFVIDIDIDIDIGIDIDSDFHSLQYRLKFFAILLSPRPLL